MWIGTISVLLLLMLLFFWRVFEFGLEILVRETHPLASQTRLGKRILNNALSSSRKQTPKVVA